MAYLAIYQSSTRAWPRRVSTLPDLRFGPVERHSLQVEVADFSAISRGFGVRIDAVIGLDVLGETNFSVDYSKGKLIFTARPRTQHCWFASGPQFMIVGLKNGGRLFHLIVDTGPPISCYSGTTCKMQISMDHGDGNGPQCCWKLGLGMIVLMQARIGTQEMGRLKALVTASRKEIRGEIDGLMGISCLRPRSISFDFEHGILGWSD